MVALLYFSVDFFTEDDSLSFMSFSLLIFTCFQVLDAALGQAREKVVFALRGSLEAAYSSF